MRRGALLYLEEFNRVPEETLNVLITVLTEGEIAVPRLGTVTAAPGVPAGRGDEPVRRDRHRAGQPRHRRPDLPGRPRLPGRRGEREITAAVTGRRGPVVGLRGHAAPGPPGSTVTCGWARRCAARSTWSLLLTGLVRLRGEPRTTRRDTARDAAYAALSGRIRVADGWTARPESVIDELLDRPVARPLTPRTTPGRGAGPDGRGKSRPPVGQRRGSQAGCRLAAAAGLNAAVPPRPGAGAPAYRRAGPSSPRSTRRSRGLARGRRARREAFARLLARTRTPPLTLLADLARRHRPSRCAPRAAAGRTGVRPAGRGRARPGPRHPAPRPWPGPRAISTSTAPSSVARRPGRPGADDLVTGPGTAHRRAVCLLVDISGSMQGLAVAHRRGGRGRGDHRERRGGRSCSRRS